MENFDLIKAFMFVLVFIPAVGLHEYCHAKFADLAGDMTPRAQGRVTLNPLAHLDPMGTIMVLISSASGFGFGWGKPVMVNVSKMRNPRWDHFVSVIMGPISNLAQALVYAFIVRYGLAQFDQDLMFGPSSDIRSLGAFWNYWCTASIFLNVGMFVFNLIPLGPLDGHWLVGAFLPPIQRNKWYAFCHGPGMFIFLILVLLPSQYSVLGRVIGPIIRAIIEFLLGYR